MRDDKINKYIGAGLMLHAVVIMLDRILSVDVPEFGLGLGYAISIGLMIIGYLEVKGILPKIKSWKKRVFSL